MTEYDFMQRVKSLTVDRQGNPEEFEKQVSAIFLESIQESNMDGGQVAEYLYETYKDTYTPTVQHPDIESAVNVSVDWANDNHVTEDYTPLDSAKSFLEGLFNVDHGFDDVRDDALYQAKRYAAALISVDHGFDANRLKGKAESDRGFLVTLMTLYRDHLSDIINLLESQDSETENE